MSTNKTTALVPVTKFTELDKIAEEACLAIDQAAGAFEKAHAMAAGITRIRDGISDEMLKLLMANQNTSLGFRTDNTAGYPAQTVKECFVEATLRGVFPVGNEFNIIAGRCYITKEGFQGKLKRHQGFTDLREDYSVPTMKEGGAIVRCKATWKMAGKEDGMEAEIPVRVNSGMGADAILGKAQRKFLKRVWERATGKVDPDGEADELDTMKQARVEIVTPTPNFGTKAEQGSLV